MESVASLKIEHYRFMDSSSSTSQSSVMPTDFSAVRRDASVSFPQVGRELSGGGVATAAVSPIDPSSPFYRSYLRAVCFLAEQCEHFYGDASCGLEKFIKDIIVGRISPNQDGFVLLSTAATSAGGVARPSGVWLDEKPTRLIRELQRQFDVSRLAASGEFSAAFGGKFCGSRAALEQTRNQFFIDCHTECLHPVVQGSRMKANTTECVPVPSSEHVAEIVGKKGGKIKNIRAETNTYIKTPKRDEEPVFVITGRKEDVALAKQKIVAAADHFTQLREARRQNAASGSTVAGCASVAGGCGGVSSTLIGPPKRDGDVTVSVEVPYEFVGLVVGLKGATIKRIQQDTNTYITTPSRRHRPIFEVVGQPLEVERAREAIRSHINSRVEKFRAENLAMSAGGSRCSPVAGMGSSGGMFSSSTSFMSSSGVSGGCGYSDLQSSGGGSMIGGAMGMSSSTSNMFSGHLQDHLQQQQHHNQGVSSPSFSSMSEMNLLNNAYNSSGGVCCDGGSSSWSTAVGMGYNNGGGGMHLSSAVVGSNNTASLINDCGSASSLSLHSSVVQRLHRQQHQPQHFHHHDQTALHSSDASLGGGCGRLSAFRQLPVETSMHSSSTSTLSSTSGVGVSSLSGELSELSLCANQGVAVMAPDNQSPTDSGVVLSGASYWNAARRCSAVPGGDPADPQLCQRRLSDDGISSSSSSLSSSAAAVSAASSLFHFAGGNLSWSSTAADLAAGSSLTSDLSAAVGVVASTALSDSLAASIAAVSGAGAVSRFSRDATNDVGQVMTSGTSALPVGVSAVFGDPKSASSETLNSDSGVELATPPPSLVGAHELVGGATVVAPVDATNGGGVMASCFGPIGSKRSSPTAVTDNSVVAN